VNADRNQTSNGASVAVTRPKPSARVVVIAIDGPSASGKSTLARKLARELGYSYVDTGAMYRTLAWWCSAQGLDVGNSRVVAAELNRWRTRLENIDGDIRLLVNGYFPTSEIRTARTTDAASKIAVHRQVRTWMVALQRDCTRFGSLVMEGRDIGTNVFPETDLKFFIDASPDARKARRDAQGGAAAAAKLAERDRRDSQRRDDPLMPGLGTYRIDNTLETPDQTVQRMLAIVKERIPLK
jgi:cytidylate kinase